MMPSHLFVTVITVFWIKGVYLSEVFQTPTDLFWKPNNEVILSLTHEIPNYNTILWYQRSAGDTSLKLIAYMYYKSRTVEPLFQSRFNASGDGAKTAYLHLLNLSHPEDSGEYFGAASIGTVLKTVTLSYKNLMMIQQISSHQQETSETM
ncbi:hypothetical protein VZT92_009050 [Zoarces viviparus]|uniref:Immunoglobulin V-set domain-containing protein n=1 Tax=Zoarces viviparus TaxID=48416 RepID=A0AAW1FHF9_ZOAVI